MIRKVEIERFAVVSSKPFDVVVAAIKASVGHPNMAELWQAAQRATTAAELEAASRHLVDAFDRFRLLDRRVCHRLPPHVPLYLTMTPKGGSGGCFGGGSD
jgi:hypothetical protein